MKWYTYLACFFAGMFLANAVPHFVNGVSGVAFPSPFSHPAGKGLSSPTVNVLWGSLNLVIGYLLFRAGKIATAKAANLIVFFAGILCISVMLSHAFANIPR